MEGVKTAKLTHYVRAWFASIAFLRNAAQDSASREGEPATINLMKENISTLN